MKRGMGVGVLVAVVIGLAVPVAEAGNRGKVVDEATVKKITEALPDKPPAKPAKKHKVLVYSKCAGFYHGSIPCGNKAFEILGQKTGAYEPVVSDDLSHFEPDQLKEFGAIIFNNSTGNLLNKAEVRATFMTWLKNGGAIVGSHAATDTTGWDEYNTVIGGRFSGHPWHELVPLKNDDPKNPINAVFGGKGFEVTDEIYQFNKGFYNRENQRVILSLDMSKIKKKGARGDNDYAISWVKTCGKGRVFYCSLGHRSEIFWNPTVMRHFLAGIQWALGDLEGVDTTPDPL